MGTDMKTTIEAMGFRPATPGDLLADLLECNGLTQREAARRLGIGRQSLIHLVHGKRSLTPDMAQRLGRLFGNGAAIWMQLQQAGDMWDLLHGDTTPYLHIEPLSEAA